MITRHYACKISSETGYGSRPSRARRSALHLANKHGISSMKWKDSSRKQRLNLSVTS